MTLSEMRQLLALQGIRLTKSLGQNFLHDANQLRRIVAAADLNRSDKVLEIGPGLGPLTERLVAQAGEVLAIEKDARLLELLQYRLQRDLSKEPGPHGVLALVHEDAMKFLRDAPRDWRDWKVVANLPYSVASPLLVELAQANQCPERMVVTLQLEVARRLMAMPGQPDYGVLTLLVQLAFEPKQFFKIPASCFFPEPDVDSACVSLQRRVSPLLTPKEAPTFVKVVKRSFSQRRKMMLKLLKEDWSENTLIPAFAHAQLSPRARAEEVSLKDFVRLSLDLHHGLQRS